MVSLLSSSIFAKARLSIICFVVFIERAIHNDRVRDMAT